MPKYLDTKKGIEGLRDVAEAVKAVEATAASHIHQLRGSATALQDYIADVRRLIDDLSRFYDLGSRPLIRKKPRGAKVLIVIMGDRGLVGGLYQSVVEAYKAVQDNYDRVAVVGEFGKRLFEENGFAVDKVLPDVSSAVTAEESSEINRYALDLYVSGDAAAVDVLFPRFLTIAEQEPAISSFLPFTYKNDQGDENDAETDASTADGFPIIAPSKHAVADQLLTIYVRLFFMAYLSEAKLSEFSARTVAMERASEQADIQIQKDTLRYFKERRRDLSRLQIESFFAHKAI